ncbi:MAG: sigma-E processing peptidase SpoIIGA, partial [Clostridia bacterium]|nr:sigma-E processing peptidase SpoIIGA [Clostridia bacterium]
MNQILYGDVLFFVNFTMDFLTLYVTAQILHRRVRPLRMAVASAIGAVYGVAACFMSGWLLYQIAVNIAVSLLMCYVAFGERILPCCALFYGSGCLLGGVMTAVYGFVNRLSVSETIAADEGYRTLSGDIPLGWMAVVAGLTGAAAITGGRYGKRKRTARDCAVEIAEDGTLHTFSGIFDSGNLLTDPLSGRPVIVMTKEALLTILPSGLCAAFEADDLGALTDLPPDLARRVRLIPSHSVGGSALLPAFLPQAIRVDGVERDALLALSPTPLTCDAIVPGVMTG